MSNLKYIILWALVAFIYGGFLFWFAAPQEKLSNEEIRTSLTNFASYYKSSSASQTQINLRALFAGDDGKEIYTIHLVRMRAATFKVEGLRTQQMSVFELLSLWVEPLLWKFYVRASYPVSIAPVVSKNINVWGDISVNKGWTHFVLMRHRSIRDLVEIINDKESTKLYPILPASIESHFSFAAAPSNVLLMLQPVIVAAWIMFALGLLANLIILYQDRSS